MIIQEGTQLTINHSRKGKMNVIALREFNTTDEWWPVILDEGERVEGISMQSYLRGGWREGDEIPCRSSLVTSYEKTGSIYEHDS